MRNYRLWLVVLLVLATLACSTFSLPGGQADTPATEAPPVVQADPTEASKPTAPPTSALPTGATEQWAIGAAASSEYSDPNWSAQQATGMPDTPECGDHDSAWASAEANSAEEWLELQYAVPVLPQEIQIYETFNPGSVVKVEVITTVSEYITVWQGRPGAVETCPRVLTVPVRNVDAPVAGIRITLDQSVVGGWNEIDAVKLIGKPAP